MKCPKTQSWQPGRGEAKRAERLDNPLWGAGKIMTGSHADSIVHGGVYDGALGVIGAIAAVAGLRAEGFRPKRSIEVVQFTSEEGDRFSEVCFGRSVHRLSHAGGL